MLLQEEMIQSVRRICNEDPQLVSALMYGSFAKGEGDRFSDIEFWCFFDTVRGWTDERGGTKVITDRDGRLAAALDQSDRDYRSPDRPARLQALCDGIVHHLLLGAAVLERGELARALDTLSHVHRHLLWMVRVVEGRAEPHRPTPSRAFESEVSPTSRARFARCTASLDEEGLRQAYIEARGWGIELMDRLGERDGVMSQRELLRED